MKKYFLLIVLMLVFSSSYGQDMSNIIAAEDQSKVSELNNSYRNHQYLEMVLQINKLLSNGNFNASVLYFMRGLARTALNDIPGARKDFIIARTSGYRNNEEYINYMTSKKYLVRSMMKDLKMEAELDSARDFHPVILPADTVRGALRMERTCFDVYFYNLTVRIIPESKSIEGKNLVYFRTTADTRIIQLDLFPEYTIVSIKMNDKELKYNRIYGGIFIDLDETVPAGTNETVVIEYKGTPVIARKPPWNGGFVWEKEKNRILAGVACEHFGASSWWPNKDHLSDKPDSMEINLQVPAGYQGISNGNLRSKSDAGSGYTNFKWFVNYPINNYNVTYYMGDFVNFNEQYSNGKSDFTIDYYVLPQNLEKAKKYYSQTKEIISVYEKLFGEYPFPKDGAGMVEAPFEGMEHQGAIAIGGEYGKSSNRRNYWTKDYDYLLIHETGHEWWGNAVAIGDMADAWINEGFTSYAECLFAEEKSGYKGYLQALAYQMSAIFDLWPIVGERDINEDTFLGGDIYNKGSAMLNNLRCIINDDTLFMGMIRKFYIKSKYKIVSTSDFVEHVKSYTGKDYSDFFNKFLYDAEPPVLACSYNFDRNNTLYFTYRWTNVGKDFTMPFCVAVDENKYVRLTGSTVLQTFQYKNAKTFFLPNEDNYDKEAVPANSFTYYWTSWPF